MTINTVRVFCALVSLLSIYYVFYFIGFSESEAESSGPTILILKVASVIAFSTFFLDLLSIFKSKKIQQYILLIIILSGAFFLIIKILLIGASDLKYLNLLMTVLPFCLMVIKKPEVDIKIFFDILVFITCVQVFIDFIIFFNGLSLWENRAFIGGVGNANAFGFLCNVSLTYLLFGKNTRKLSDYFYVSILSIGIIFTVSLMSALYMFLIYFLYFLRKNLALTLFVFFGVVFIFISYYEYLLSDHLIFKFESLMALASGGEEAGSRSVTLRVQIYNEFFNQMKGDFLHVLMFGYHGYSYYIADSQFLTYIGSFGIIWSLLFFGFIAYFCLKSVFDHKNLFLSLVFIQFFLYFIVNRVLDYFPVGILLSIIITMAFQERKSNDNVV